MIPKINFTTIYNSSFYFFVFIFVVIFIAFFVCKIIDKNMSNQNLLKTSLVSSVLIISTKMLSNNTNKTQTYFPPQNQNNFSNNNLFGNKRQNQDRSRFNIENYTTRDDLYAGNKFQKKKKKKKKSALDIDFQNMFK